MAVRQRGDSWQADISLDGKRHRHTFETEKQASDWCLDAKHASKMGRPIPLPETPENKASGGLRSMGDIFELTCRDVWGNKKSSQKLAMNGRLFIDWFGTEREPSDVDEGILADYVHYCRSHKMNSDPTINRTLSAIRVMLTVARKRKLIQQLPEFERYKETQGVINYLVFKEEDQILTHLKHHGLDVLADLVVILIDTGARINEALRIEFQHIQNTGHLFFPDRKSGNLSSIPMTSRVKIALENRRIHGPDPRLPFGGIKQQWARDRLKDIYKVLGGRYEDIEQPFHILSSFLRISPSHRWS